MRLALRTALVALVLFAAILPAPAQSKTYTIRLPFQQGAALKIDTALSGVKVSDLQIRRDNKSPFDQVRGGENRYSWFEYDLSLQPTEGARNVRVIFRLYDANDAIIDDFELTKRVWRDKEQVISARRITLNYIVPLVKEVEVTITAE